MRSGALDGIASAPEEGRLAYRYRITVEPLVDEGVAPDAREPLVFTAVNHDDILGVLEKTRGQVELDEDERASFAIGLKLLSEVVLKHRAEAPYASLFGPLREFIGELKASKRPS